MSANTLFSAAIGLLLVALANVAIRRGFVLSFLMMVVAAGCGLAGFNVSLGNSPYPCPAILAHLNYGADPEFGIVRCQRMVLERTLGWSVFRTRP